MSSTLKTKKNILQPFPLKKIDRYQANYHYFDFNFESYDWLSSGFSSDYFLMRYWSGDDALRDSRSLSRKRLSLIRAGIENEDTEAISLHAQIESYRQAVELIRDAESLTIENLCHINRLLTPDHQLAGQLRKKQTSLERPILPAMSVL